jgi:hypothetical protein
MVIKKGIPKKPTVMIDRRRCNLGKMTKRKVMKRKCKTENGVGEESEVWAKSPKNQLGKIELVF